MMIGTRWLAKIRQSFTTYEQSMYYRKRTRYIILIRFGKIHKRKSGKSSLICTFPNWQQTESLNSTIRERLSLNVMFPADPFMTLLPRRVNFGRQNTLVTQVLPMHRTVLCYRWLGF